MIANPHTPGPWRVADGDVGSILAPSVSKTPDRYVQVICFDGDKYLYQSPGDAALIAAAPKMLEALQAAVNWFTPPNDSKTAFPIKQIAEALAKARRGPR